MSSILPHEPHHPGDDTADLPSPGPAVFAGLTYSPLDEDLGDNQRWSTWTAVERGARGPNPRPDWVVTDDSAVDTELGVLKTGKEADVFLVERAVQGDDTRSVVMAAKRYRTEEHRTFHRSSTYTDGRRTRRYWIR